MRISDWSSDVCSSDLLAGDTGFARGLELLAAAPEDEGIAALQAHDLLAGLCLADDQRVDPVLPHRVAAALLGDADPLDVRRDQGEHARADQSVANDQIGAGHDRKSTRLNSSHYSATHMPSSA